MHRFSPLAHAARLLSLRALVQGLASLPLTDERALVAAAEAAAAVAVQATLTLPDLPLTSAAAHAVLLAVEAACGDAPLDPPIAPASPAAAAVAALARGLQPRLVQACPRLGVVRAANTSIRAAIAALAAAQHLLTSPAVLTPATCLAVLGAASRARAPAARAAARSTAVAAFAAAAAAAPAALAALPARDLADVLADDALEATELEAFSAVSAWVDAARGARARALPGLVAAGVRLTTLPPAALAALDAHPAVRACPATTRAVATAYVRLMVAAPAGGVHDGRRAAKLAAASPSPSPSADTPPPSTTGAESSPAGSPRPAPSAACAAARPPTAVSAAPRALPVGGDVTPPRRRRPAPGSARVLAKRLCLE